MDETAVITVEQIEALLSNNSQLTNIVDLLGHIYVAQLFCIGTVCALVVCVILYKSLKVFH